MKYLLKNKNKVVLEFEVSINTQTYEDISRQYALIKNIKSINDDLLPRSMNDLSLDSLQKWIKKRKIPKNRAFVNDILKTLNADSDDNFMAYIDISLGLSLNDSYWIIPASKEYKWSDFNLYDNEFDKALALVAFNGGSYKASKITSSPEYTTNGMLKKCWHRDNGIIYLYKGSSEKYANGGKESYAEYYMAQIAEVLEFDFVPYDLKEFHGQLVSTCPLFTNENEGYLNIYDCLDKDIRQSYKFKLIELIQKVYGKSNFEDLMLFDALICNVDRHLGNFGMMIDNNTNEILRPAPIFDNGFSMINILTQDELRDIPNAIANMQHSFFDFSFDEQLRLFVQPRHIPNLEKLQSFEFQKHKKFNLPDEWLESIQKAIQDRAKLAIDFCYKKQSKTIATDKIRAMPKPSAEIDAKGKEFLNELRQARNADSKNALNTLIFTDKQGNSRKVSNHYQDLWLKTFRLKSVEEFYTPKYSDSIREALQNKEIRLTKGSLFKLAEKNRLQYIPQIKQTLDEPDIILKDIDRMVILAKRIDDRDFFASVNLESDNYFISISNAPKKEKVLKNKIASGAKIIYQSPNAKSIFYTETLLQNGKSPPNKIDNANSTTQSNQSQSKPKTRSKQ